MIAFLSFLISPPPPLFPSYLFFFSSLFHKANKQDKKTKHSKPKEKANKRMHIRAGFSTNPKCYEQLVKSHVTRRTKNQIDLKQTQQFLFFTCGAVISPRSSCSFSLLLASTARTLPM